MFQNINNKFRKNPTNKYIFLFFTLFGIEFWKIVEIIISLQNMCGKFQKNWTKKPHFPFYPLTLLGVEF